MNGDTDEPLRRMLRAADPAASATPVRDDEIHRLATGAMARGSAPDAGTPSSAFGRMPGWRRRGIGIGAGLAAAAVVGVIAVVGLTPTGTAPTALTQTGGAGGPAAMCAMVTPEAIAASDVAFRAEVSVVESGTVTLDVTEIWRGDPGDMVTVPQGDGEPIDGGPLVFEAGGGYLIAASDGVVKTCGLSGVDSPELEALYEQAFPG